jgi:hypothetical protein
MAVFVHFTDENNKNSIVKNGIKIATVHYKDIKKGIFCMPVIPDFYATHQWVRELKQYNSGNEIIAIYFKIPDDEIIFCGKYNEEFIKTDATKAHNIFMNLEDKMGFQVIIERKIISNEITKIKNIPQVIGWRHFPKSHERKRCLCPACLTKGSFNSMKTKRLKLKKMFSELNNAKEFGTIKEILYDIGELKIKDKVGTKNERKLLELLEMNNHDLNGSIIYCMSKLYKGHYRDFYLENIYNEKLVDESLEALHRIYGEKILTEIEMEKCTNVTIEKINEYRDIYEIRRYVV